jgi:hypothetical protein
VAKLLGKLDVKERPTVEKLRENGYWGWRDPRPFGGWRA